MSYIIGLPFRELPSMLIPYVEDDQSKGHKDAAAGDGAHADK